MKKEKNSNNNGFLQMASLKYTIASSLYYTGMFTHLFPKRKMNFTFQPVRFFRKRLIDCTIYFLMTLPFLNCVPVHVFPLPVNPGLQVQLYDPMVL